MVSSIATLVLLCLSPPLSHANLRLTTAGTSDPNSQHHHISVDWTNVTAVSKTTATLQVVANPVLNKKISPVATKLFENLRDLDADMVRYVPWFPYPLYAVAELEPPNYQTKTSYWNFTTDLKQQFLDTFHAVINTNNKGEKRIVINFSTQPTWMFNTTTWDYNPDPNRFNWGYVRGNALPNTTQLVAEYYGRLALWMIKGEFEDEFGNTITGGPALGNKITHWEIFNEPEAEHKIMGQEYNDFFDAIVKEIRKQVDPDHKIQFVGMALAFHNEWPFWETFLTPSKHDEDAQDAVSSGMASFHFYAFTHNCSNITSYVEVFDQLDVFLQEVDHIIALRNKLNPTTQLFLNEAGAIAKFGPEIPALYFNMAAALFTVLVSELSVKGVDAVGSSQLVANPVLKEWGIPDANNPSVSMTNWTTGAGNPRYWALKLYLQYFGPGDTIVETTKLLNNDNVFVQSRITHEKKQTMIIVNKSLQNQVVECPHLVGAKIQIVDEETHDEEWKVITSASSKLTLTRFAVAVAEISGDVNWREALPGNAAAN